MLFPSIIVAGNRPGSDVDAVLDLTIPQIGKMHGFRLLSEHRTLHLDEVPHFRLLADDRIRSYAGKRSDSRLIFDDAFHDHRRTKNLHAVSESRISDMREGIQTTFPPDHRAAFDDHGGINHSIRADLYVQVDPGCPGIQDRCSFVREAPDLPFPKHVDGLGQFIPAVDPHELSGVLGFMISDLLPFLSHDSCHIGQIEFPFLVLVRNLGQSVQKILDLEKINAGVDLVDLPLRRRGIPFLDNSYHSGRSDDPPETLRVFQLCTQEG